MFIDGWVMEHSIALSYDALSYQGNMQSLDLFCFNPRN